MPVKPDTWIIKKAQNGMIEPFEPAQVRTGISFGTSSYGYDFRISNEWQIPSAATDVILDPKKLPADFFYAATENEIVIPAGGFVLGRTIEYFRIPRDILTICFGKSTYARCGVFVNVTPFEPEWEGYATISIINGGNNPVRIYAGEGIAQLIFIEAAEICAVSYADKKGKYQAQKIITTAKT